MTSVDPVHDIQQHSNTIMDSPPPNWIGRISPEGLLATMARPKNYGAAGNRIAERVLRKLLTQLRFDELEITSPNGHLTRYGKIDLTQKAPLVGHMQVYDSQMWRAIATEGSVGLGRSYIEGWWDSPDPVAVIQILLRNFILLDKARNIFATSVKPLKKVSQKIRPATSKARNKEDIASHYDIGNSFFKLFLDETMTYSSGVFLSDDETLTQASINKYDRLLDKLSVDSNDHLLEVGTGWGAMAIRAATQRNCQVTTTTISEEQFAEVQKRIGQHRENLPIEVLKKDWRDLTGTHDKIVSIEMIEAVDWRDYKKFFKKLEDNLSADGLIGLQAICVPDRNFERIKHTEDFIRRFVFPGGYLPSIGAISKALRSTQLQIIDVEDFSAHYSETLRRWRATFDQKVDEIKMLGLDDKFIRLWRFYLAYCEAGFTERHCSVNQIIIAGPQWRPDGLALRPC